MQAAAQHIILYASKQNFYAYFAGINLFYTGSD